VTGAEDRLATAEDLSEQELEEIHVRYRALADKALSHLQTRREKN
jgi:hypothetical protein